MMLKCTPCVDGVIKSDPFASNARYHTKDADPYLGINEDLQVYIKPQADLRQYALARDNQTATLFFSELQDKNIESEKILLDIIVRHLCCIVKEEERLDQLSATFSPDEAFMFAPKELRELDHIQFIGQLKESPSIDGNLSVSSVVEDDVTSLFSAVNLEQHSPSHVMSIGQLLESALEVAGQVVGTSVSTTPVSTTPLPYSTMAGHCEALETSTRMELSNWLSQENISAGNALELPSYEQAYSNQLDKFIPNISAMDFDYAHYMLTDGKKGKENPAAPSSPAGEAYQKQLRDVFNMNRTRILAFKNKPPVPVELMPQNYVSVQQSKPVKPRRHIPQTSERTLDAPDLLDDYYLNLLDWGSSNVLAIALEATVYLWNATTGSTSVTSVNWAPDGLNIAVGLNNSETQLWDTTANCQLRTLKGGHTARVGSLAWNNHILTTGSMDGKIINNDVRIRDHIVETYRGHQQEVCGLKWSASGQQLASGGNDNLLHIWDRSLASSNSTAQWLHRLEDHTVVVKALAWCPFQSNLLASGGAGGDRCIKFWNSHTGACLNSVDTGSQVSSLLWSKNERELLSSHGFTQNQLTLRK